MKSLLGGSYQTTPRPGAGISRSQGAGVPPLPEVIHSLVNDDGPAGDVDLSQEGGQLVAELADHLALRVSLDVAQVAHMSLSRGWPSVIFLVKYYLPDWGTDCWMMSDLP